MVGMADMKISADPEDTLVTYALGSCVAVCAWDPVHLIGGMIHYMLPLSKVNPEKAKLTPAMFADSGLPMMCREMFAKGSVRSQLSVKIVGGGVFLDNGGVFNIGPRNVAIVRALLKKNGIDIAAEDVGGPKSRTVRMSINTGRVIISARGVEQEL